MFPAIARFLAGLLIGTGALFLAGRFLVLFVDSSGTTTDPTRNQSRAQHEASVAGQYDPPILVFSLIGGLICAACCAAAGPTDTPARPQTRRRSSIGTDDSLSRDEFHQVLQACLPVPIDDRSPDYVRGLVVGRLADTAPALAHKVDGFSDRHMAALHRDLLHRQDKLSRGRR
jgi:hypothetical protein